MSAREPYDHADRNAVEDCLIETGRVLVDPLGKDGHSDDLFFAPSLAAARQQMTEAFGTWRSDGTAFRVYPVFTERGFPNAFARDLGSVHVVGIHTGMATIAFELSAFTFAQRDAFVDVGDVGTETSPQLPPDAQLGFWIADRLRADAHPRTQPAGLELMPKCPQRQLMAHFLAHMMLRFAWYHELFHCLNGHCGLMRVEGIEVALHEMPEDGELSLAEPDDAVIAGMQAAHALQAMEIDADRSAIWTMLKLQLSDDEPFEVLAAQPRSLRLRLVTTAALLMVFLFEQSARRSRGGASSTHPEARTRLLDLCQTLASASDGTGGSFLQDALSALPHGHWLVGAVREAATQGAVLGEINEDLKGLRSLASEYAFLSR